MKIIQVKNEREYVEHMTESLIDKLCLMITKNNSKIYIICYNDVAEAVKQFFDIIEIKEVTEEYKSELIITKEYRDSIFIGRFDFINSATI